MSDIRVLPIALVNRIAAGECIERPASIVKELIENSLDAHATRIDIAIEDGGTKLIRVVDNGQGIATDQLTLAVTPHATSKLAGEDDLFNISTMGFRGEALASIAAVSIVRLTSIRPGADSGGQLDVVDGVASDVRPIAGSPGTTVEVQNLFYNTPARRKFLKTGPTEFGHIQERVIQTAMAHPRVAFTLKHGQRSVLDLPATTDMRQRLADIFGPELANPLMQVFVQDRSFTFQAYISRPEDSRPSNRWQYFFVNHRPIRDKYLAHALKESYRGLLGGDRQPIAFLFLDVAPDSIDVNVHPTKSEVRFRDSGEVHSLVLGAIRDRFLSTPMPTSIDDVGRPSAPRTIAPTADDSTPVPAPVVSPIDRRTANTQESVRHALAEFLQSAAKQPTFEFAGSHPAPTPTSRPSLSTPIAPATHRPAMPAIPHAEPKIDAHPYNNDGPASSTEQIADVASAPTEPSSALPTTPDSPAVQLHNSYIATQDADGILIIDQHALHERILYENLRRSIAAGAIPRQRLLVPQVLNLTAGQQAQLQSIIEPLAKLGFEIEPFGPQSVAVHSLPTLAGAIDACDLLQTLLDSHEESVAPDPSAVFERILATIACKAAVKAGDPLDPSEIQALLRSGRHCDGQWSCPHGRPTSLRLSLTELEKRFKRT